MKWMRGRMPDLTPAALLVYAQWIASQLLAYGWIDDETKTIALSGASTIAMFVGWFADSFLRGKRNMAEAIKEAAKSGIPPVVAPPKP